MNESSFVYGFTCEEFLKVGHSSNPESRIRDFKAIVPFKMNLVFEYAVPNKMSAVGLEKQALARLKSAGYHEKGEWFRNDAKVLEILDSVAEDNPTSSLIESSQIQMDLWEIGKMIEKLNGRRSLLGAINYLEECDMFVAAAYISTFGTRTRASSGGLVFPEHGSEDTLLGYLVNKEAQEAE